MSTKKKIVEIASAMFVEEGIKTVRMDDIARRCGISKRTLYELFADRSELISLALEHYINSMKQNGEEAARNAENAFHAVWLRFTQYGPTHKLTSKILCQLKRYYPQLGTEFVTRMHEAVVANILDTLKVGVEEGLVMGSLDLHFYSRAMTNYIIGLDIIEENISITGLQIEPNSIPNAVILFLRGIATDKGREYIDNNFLTHK